MAASPKTLKKQKRRFEARLRRKLRKLKGAKWIDPQWITQASKKVGLHRKEVSLFYFSVVVFFAR